MAAYSISQEQQFLNRLALFTGENAIAANPVPAIEHFFALAPESVLKSKWQRYSMLAFDSKNMLAGDAPDCIDYFERLELLFEACYLLYTREDASNPSFVSFFTELSLGSWKKIIESWRNAAISNHSIVDSLEPPFLLGTYLQIHEIIDAAGNWLRNTDAPNHLLEESLAIYRSMLPLTKACA